MFENGLANHKIDIMYIIRKLDCHPDSTENLDFRKCSVQILVLSVLEPVGRLGSFGVTNHVNLIGFSISHHV